MTGYGRSAQIVIIGAGVVGAALADELIQLGCTDVTVLEQGKLPAPGGSSSHAPGLVFQANSSKTMTNLARYTVEKLATLSTDDGPCFLPVGGLEVATTPERSAELERRAGWLAAWGVDHELLDAEQTAKRYPLLQPSVVLGGLFTPTDGLAKAVRAVQAQLDRAVLGGARVLDSREVLDILRSEDGRRVIGVRTDAGDIDADVVVCCAGIWGPKVAAMVGMTLPLTPLAHQFAWTSAVATVAGAGAEAVLPILRHQDQDLYFRESFDRIGIGYYGHRPLPVSVDELATPATTVTSMPSVLEFTPPDFEPAWRESQRLLPVLADAEIDDAINGLFSFTTDNFPLLGPASRVDGFWVAEAVWVTHSAGVGRAMAEWLVAGYSESFELHECDVNRFEEHQLAPDYVLARASQNFVEVYDILHPLEPPQELRPIRVSPFVERQRELGAVFLEAAGWERPQWYEANAVLPAEDVPTPDPWAARFWSPIVAAEAQATRRSVALYDMTALKRLDVSGPGATAYLQNLVSGDVAKSVGSVTYCLLLDHDGGIRSDLTVSRLGAEHYQIGANSRLDLDWLLRQRPAGSAVQVRDITAGTTCIGLWGPRARDVLASLTRDDVSNAGLKYFRGRRTYLGPVPVLALRLSYVGELGWELYTTADNGLKLWDILWAAGAEHDVIAAGRGAFNSLRLEKGYRSWGSDMTFEHDPFEAGLGFAVKMDKPAFIGRAALLERQGDVRRQLCCLDTGSSVVMGKEPVFAGDSPVGYVTSAAYGYTVGHGIAYAWLPSGSAEPGTGVEIGYFGQRIAATVRAEPLFDPAMQRIRG